MPFPFCVSASNLLTACAILAAGFAATAPAQQPEAGRRRPPPLPVVTEAVKSQSLSGSIQLPGSIETVRRTQVAASIAGLVVDLLVREGDHVEKGETLGRLATAPLEARRAVLEAQVAESDARLRSAESKFGRAKELFAAGVIPAEQLDDSHFEVEALGARAGSLKAQIAEIELGIRQSAIRAPFAGGISAKLSEVGQWASVGDPLVDLVAVDDLEVRVDVPEMHLSKIRLGQSAAVDLEALPGLKLRGAVRSVAPVADPDSRTFPVKLSVEAAGRRVRPGMVALVSFAAARPREVMLAPKDALVERPAGWVVFVVQPDATVKETPVRLGASVDAWTEVAGNVAAGDEVVVLGNERLRDGQSVTPKAKEPPAS